MSDSRLTDYAKTRIQYKVAAAMDRGSSKTQAELAAEIGIPHGTFRSALRLVRARAEGLPRPDIYSPVTIESPEQKAFKDRMVRMLVPPAPLVVGVIGDTHLPYEHPNYLSFCQETFAEHGVNEVIHIGDLIDNHSLSFHTSEPGLRGSRGEYEDARKRLDPWFRAFPDLKLVYGNHDAIPARQLKNIGMDPDQYLRPMEAVYGFPPGWSVHEEIEIDGVLYHHGHTAVGVNGFRNDAKARFQSTVTGHAHGNSGVAYTATQKELVYGCAVGCGIDARSMAFAYGKHFKQKPIVSCAVIKDEGRLPMVFPMKV